MTTTKQTTAKQTTMIQNAESATPIHNGTYTISNPKTGAHRTFRIRTIQKGKLEGKRVVELLTGSDNSRDFTGFAFIDDQVVTVWSKLRGDGTVGYGKYSIGAPFDLGIRHRIEPSSWERLAATVADALAPGHVKGGLRSLGFRVDAATVCLVCNRKLTTPESIERGIGPDCAAKAEV